MPSLALLDPLATMSKSSRRRESWSEFFEAPQFQCWQNFRRGLQQRHIQMIALAGTIGTVCCHLYWCCARLINHPLGSLFKFRSSSCSSGACRCTSRISIHRYPRIGCRFIYRRAFIPRSSDWFLCPACWIFLRSGFIFRYRLEHCVLMLRLHPRRSHRRGCVDFFLDDICIQRSLDHNHGFAHHWYQYVLYQGIRRAGVQFLHAQNYAHCWFDHNGELLGHSDIFYIINLFLDSRVFASTWEVRLANLGLDFSIGETLFVLFISREQLCFDILSTHSGSFRSISRYWRITRWILGFLDDLLQCCICVFWYRIHRCCCCRDQESSS